MSDTKEQNVQDKNSRTSAASNQEAHGAQDSHGSISHSGAVQQSNAQTPKSASNSSLNKNPASSYSFAQQQAASPRPNKEDERALRSAQSKITFAYIAGPVSLFLGGMLLGCIGLICAGLAYRSIGQLEHKETSVAQAATKLKKSACTALIICCIAFVLNAISMYFMYPIILDMLQNGQFGNVAGSISSSSTWG